MIIIEGTARLRSAAWKTALPVMSAMIEASRKEAGCIEYAYSRDLLDPDLMRIIERWKDRDALAFHFSTPHMMAFRKALAELKPQSIDVRMYEADPEPLPG